MKSAVIAVAAMLFALLTVPASAPHDDPADVPGWGLPAWRDEFSGDSVDPEKWTVWDRSTHGNFSFDWGDLSEQAVSVQDGMLRIRLSQLDTPVYSGGRERGWRTGALDTQATHNERWGRWEIRAKIPTTAGDSSGVWPAFWLRNAPALGEIDILESWGDPPQRPRSPDLTETSTLTLHERTVAPHGERAAWTYEHGVAELSAPYTTASGFHTWTIEYTPAEFKAFFDGVLVAHATPDGADGTTALPWVWGETFDSPWYMRLNLAMGDPYWTPDPVPGNPHSVMPADFLIDYVRYWALPEP
ncbi:glycoside hydrolase family 16 protein [Phytoactinopolyspora mesophila]|nr:glycoside hydrolase family 16 protein [Phytoactinopolyspora mesophila]